MLPLLIISCAKQKENSNSNKELDISNSNISKETSSSVLSVDNKPYYNFSKHIKLYLNPSVQYNNFYYDNVSNEGMVMNNISNKIEQYLKEYTNIEIYSNNNLPGLPLNKSVLESNNLEVDYHLAIHSNAGGGSGCEGWYNGLSYDFAKEILSSLSEVLPYKNRGLKDGSKSLYELKNTTSNACLIEILFHDEKEQSEYILNNKQKIAQAISLGIINYLKSIE